MATAKITLTGAKETLLYTLYFRALDHRSKAPLVGDPWADEVLSRIDHNHRKLKMRASDRFFVLLRAKRLDDWTREFLDRHPDATVLHLGCGLDSRAFRIDAPEAVRWYDLDYPEVIELRRRVYPERDSYQMIASSVTDPGWLDGIPTDRLVLVIAEGLLMYLAETDVKQLFGRLVDRFPHSELFFDAMTPGVTKLSKLLGWSLRDPDELERWNPRLTLIDDVPIISDFERIPLMRYRMTYRLLNTIPATRNMVRLLRYRF
ncbi:MAG: class I SAM-dependent methyltransferase [Streptosporangiales bacterium]|nr:class I SAM-dependent methyltransferase [Streptosporangiales bacterium]